MSRKAAVIFIYFMVLFSQRATATPCSLSTSSLRESTQQIYKRTAEQMATDPLYYCRRNALLEYLKKKEPNRDYQSTSMKDLEKKVQNYTNEDIDRINKITSELSANQHVSPNDSKWFMDIFNDPWTTSLVPNHDRRSIAMAMVLWAMGTDQDHVMSAFSQPEKMSPQIKQQIQKNVERLRQNGLNSQAELNTAFLRTLACGDMGVGDASDCAEALKSISPKFLPSGSANGKGTKFSDLDDWKQVMTDDRYDEGLRMEALQLSIHLYNGGTMLVNQNIYDDLKSNFERSNMSPKEAAQAASMTMAILANGAANTNTRVDQLESKDINVDSMDAVNPALSQKGKALSFIAAALPLEDGNFAPSGHLYSMPANADSNCDDSKSYHFWMIFRLAQRIVQEDHVAPLVAAKAAFVIEKAYLLLREQGRPTHNSDGFDGNTPLENPVYDASSLLDRGDLSFAAAGAFAGALSGSANPPRINVDSSLSSMIQDGAVLPPLTHDDAQSMGPIQKALRWESIFAPNSAFENVKQQVYRSIGNK